jgi:hypothetical protein
MLEIAHRALALFERLVLAQERIADELARARGNAGRAAALAAVRAELLDYFGAGSPFTTAGVLDLADDLPRLADALAAVIDMKAPARSRATQLGVLLRQQPWVQVSGTQRNAAVYRLCEPDD